MASELTYDIVEGEKWSLKLFCILWDWESYFSELNSEENKKSSSILVH